MSPLPESSLSGFTVLLLTLLPWSLAFGAIHLVTLAHNWVLVRGVQMPGVPGVLRYFQPDIVTGVASARLTEDHHRQL